MNSNEIVGFIFDKLEKKYTEDIICKEVVTEARSRWEYINLFKLKLQTQKTHETVSSPKLNKQKKILTIDDITAIVCFLKEIDLDNK